MCPGRSLASTVSVLVGCWVRAIAGARHCHCRCAKPQCTPQLQCPSDATRRAIVFTRTLCAPICSYCSTWPALHWQLRTPSHRRCGGSSRHTLCTPVFPTAVPPGRALTLLLPFKVHASRSCNQFTLTTTRPASADASETCRCTLRGIACPNPTTTTNTPKDAVARSCADLLCPLPVGLMEKHHRARRSQSAHPMEINFAAFGRCAQARALILPCPTRATRSLYGVSRLGVAVFLSADHAAAGTGVTWPCSHLYCAVPLVQWP